MPGVRLTADQRLVIERAYMAGGYSAKWSQREAARKARRPKGADLRHLTTTECDHVALSLNTRPRQTLEWQTPGQALNKRLAATAV